jgi:hypothetical protein
MRKRHLRDRRPRAGYAPAAPAELRRRRTEQLPTGADHFVWFAGEVALGPPRVYRDETMARLTALYGRSPPEDPGR